jgi:hypothetical protein
VTKVLVAVLGGVAALVLLIHGGRGIARRRLETRSGEFQGRAALAAGIFLVLFGLALVALIPALFSML